MLEFDRPADDPQGPPAAGGSAVAPDSPYPFTERELARLLIFRAAVDAGFYTDGLGPTANSRGPRTMEDEPCTA